MTATKLFNVRDNRYEYVGDDQLDGALRSGVFRLPAGQSIRVFDNQGQQYEADNRTNFSQLTDYQFETNFAKQNRFLAEEAAQQPLLAGVAAAARGATFGLSDVAAESLGLAQKFKNLKEQNPVASTIGEIGGTIASAIALPGGGLVGGAAKIGQAGASVAERVIAGAVVKGATEAGATTLGKDIAKRAAMKALTAGTGGFVEGSLYGVGQTISEAALGDPSEAAEHLIGNIGLAGLVNGSIMGATGAIGSIVKRSIPPGVSREEFDATRRAVSGLRSGLNEAEKEVGAAIAEKPTLINKASELYLKALEKFVPISDDTKAILKPIFEDPTEAKALVDFMDNAPEALQTVSETMNRMVASTEQASKFLAVQGRRESIARMPTAFAENIKAGETVAQQIIKDIDNVIKKVKRNPTAFDAQVRKELRIIRDTFEKKTFAKGMAEAEEIVAGLLGAPVIRKALKETVTPKFANNIELMNDMNDTWRKLFDVKKFYTETPRTMMTPKAKRTADLMNGLYSKVVDQTFNESAFGSQVAQENREISKIIAEQMAAYRELKSKFFTKRIIQGQKTEVFDPDKFTRFLKSDESKRILQNDIFENYMVSSAKTMKLAEQFGVQEALFQEAGGVIDDTISSIADMKRLRTAMTALGALESHTGKSLQKTVLYGVTGAVLGGGVGQAIGAGIGYAMDNPVQILRYLNQAQTMIIDNKSLLNRGIQQFVGLGKATAEGIAEMGEPIGRAGLQGMTVPKAIRLGTVQAIDPEAEEPVSLEQLLVNPTENTVERIMYKHKELGQVMPAVTGQIGAQAYNAIEFLKSKMPKDPNTSYSLMPEKVTFTIPASERLKFERYVDAINDPTSLVKKMNAGTLTAEHVEALQVVYPKLYDETQRTVMELLSEKKNLTFKQKVQLGLFMQVPTMPAYDPTVFASIQTQYAIRSQEEQGMKVPQTLGQTQKTSFERAITR